MLVVARFVELVRGGLVGVHRLKEMNGHHPKQLPVLIISDEHRRARPRVKLLDAFRYVSGICGISQLFEQAAECGRVSGRCWPDFERVRPLAKYPPTFRGAQAPRELQLHLNER